MFISTICSNSSLDNLKLKSSVLLIDSIIGFVGTKKYKMTKIIEMLCSIKQQVDTDNIALAKKKYVSFNKFLKWFSYRKGVKIYLLKNITHIV